MPELAVVEVEVERSRIEVSREVGIRVLARRRDLIVCCSPVPPLSLLLPFRPLDPLSVCVPFSSSPLLLRSVVLNVAALLECVAAVRVPEPLPWTVGCFLE
jgi:hypothetical protein